MSKKLNVGIFLFEDAEVLDIAGPFEVFSVTSQLHDYQLCEVFTLAKRKELVRAVNGLKIMPDYSLEQHPPIDILILAGGQGTRLLLSDSQVLQWLKTTLPTSRLTLSICSAARLLARIGALQQRPFCTHHEVYDHVLELEPQALPQRDLRFVQSANNLYTSGGISAGIDLSLHIVARQWGAGIAQQTATYMEYPWKGV